VAEVPVYSFEKHARVEQTTTVYSPHVLILEGIFALHDQRVLDMLDLKIFAEADADLCLSRRCGTQSLFTIQIGIPFIYHMARLTNSHNQDPPPS